MTQPLLALDTATIYYRSFHGVPSSLTAPDGTVINAVRGTLDALAVLIEQFEPAKVVAAWDDAWRPRWRTDLVAEYKAHRVKPGTENDEDVPPELAPQIPLVREALELLGMAVVGQADQEADDILGALARDSSGELLVVSGDRDLFQLVDDAQQVAVIYTGAGMKKLQRVDNEWLASKYGLQPGHYLDFAALRGDASDGLPGVAGIGDKTAARLLNEFGDLDGIMAVLDEESATLTPRIRQNLREATEYLRAVREVIEVGRGVTEVQLPPTMLDSAGFSEFAERWGLGRPAERALAAVQNVN